MNMQYLNLPPYPNRWMIWLIAYSKAWPDGLAVSRHATVEPAMRRAVSSQSSHHPQEVLLAQFSLYVHKSGLKPGSFHFLWEATWSFPKMAFPIQMNLL